MCHFSEGEKKKMILWGLKRVPTSCLGQIHFLAGKITNFKLSYLKRKRLGKLS